MSLLDRVQRSNFRSYRRAESGAPPPLHDDFWYGPIGVGGSGPINPDAAMTVAAFWQGSRLIAEGIASMPCHLLRRKGEDGRERVRNSPMAYRLRWQPNETQTAFDFWQLVCAAVILRGLFVAELVPGIDPVTGQADFQLNPLHPDLVRPKKLPSGRVVYEVHDTPGGRQLSQDRVFAVRGRTEGDGVTPMSLIRYGAMAIGAAMAADQFAAQFFRQGAAPALAVISKDDLGGEEGIANLHSSITKYVGGVKNAFGVLVLEGDTDVKPLGISPHDAQLILTRQFSVEEVARLLNVPLHMLRYSQQGTGSYASLEVFSAEFVTYTLRPLAVQIEQSIARDLVFDQDKDELFAEFNMDALLRGDLKSRYEAYRIGIMSGFLRRNEARIKENLDPADGLDKFLEPMNMASADNHAGRAGGDTSSRILQFSRMFRNGREAYRMVSLAQTVAGRVLRRERAAVEKLAQRHANDADAWAAGLREFYLEHAGFIANELKIPLSAAQAYAAKQGAALQRDGVASMASWDATAMEPLALLALEGTADDAAA